MRPARWSHGGRRRLNESGLFRFVIGVLAINVLLVLGVFFDVAVTVVAALFTGEHPTQVGVLLDGRTSGVATCDRE